MQKYILYSTSINLRIKKKIKKTEYEFSIKPMEKNFTILINYDKKQRKKKIQKRQLKGNKQVENVLWGKKRQCGYTT